MNVPDGAMASIAPRRIAAKVAVWGTFGVGLLLMATVSVSTIRSTSSAANALAKLEAKRALASGAARLLSDIRESQSERRAYLLAGDQYFLTQHRNTFALVRRGAAVLDSLVREDSALIARARTVEVLIEKLDSLGRSTIAERTRGGIEAAAAMVRSRSVDVLVSQIERKLHEIEALEERAAANAIAGARASSHSAQRVAILCSVLAMVLVLIASLIIREDIRQQRQRSELLKAAVASALAAKRAKGEFLATMSHEIRTPLNGIIGMTELAMHTDLSPEQREYLLTVRTSADSLLRLINDILDFSKIEAGRLDLDPTPFAVREMLADAIRPLRYRAEQKGLKLAQLVTDRVPGTVVGDAGRLQQVIVNLVGNAIKFTARGEIAVTMDAMAVSATEVELHVSVRDTGIGIAPEHHRSVFELFTQADSSTTRRFGGTGLGLTISEQLVKLMGGGIWVESEAGKGSTFHFTATLRPASSALRVPNRQQASDGDAPPKSWSARVLVVEDNEVNQRVARGLLERRGVTVSMASDGRQALAMLAGAGALQFDIVFMDVEMPELDGLTATRLFRDEELRRATGRRLPIVAVTAHALAGDHARCLAAGMDACLTKPLNSAELDRALERYLDASQVVAVGAEGNRAAGVSEAQRRDSLLALVGGDHELLSVVVNVYLEQTPRRMSDLHGAIAGRDAEEVARLAHQLRGSSLQVGGTAVAEVAGLLERSAGQGRLADAASMLHELGRANAELEGFLKHMTAQP